MRVHNHSKGVTPSVDRTLNGSSAAWVMQSTGDTDNCSEPGAAFQHSLYAVVYTLIFIPGILMNSMALWVLYRFVRKHNKTIIFMVNLATADLAHVLSLPLRIYYYINYRWPFGTFLCQFCFYLKYLNMYASICFLTCISVQRCIFLLYPFRAKDWKQRYDVVICVAVWIVVGAACSLFLLFRTFNSSEKCFTELSINKIGSETNSILLVMVAEVVGFLVPLVIIIYCTKKTKASLQECSNPLQNATEKQKALRMVASCAIVFLVCFTPYHIMFFFFMLVKERMIKNCAIRQSILYIHPFCLSLASFNCCLDPILYFFTTSEFQSQVSRHSSLAIRSRLMSKESASSVKEEMRWTSN